MKDLKTTRKLFLNNAHGVPEVILLTVLLIAFAGCASIINGSNQDITITSRPEGAKITIYDKNNMEVWSSVTPSTVSLQRGRGYFQGATYRVVIEKKAFQRKSFKLQAALMRDGTLSEIFSLGH